MIDSVRQGETQMTTVKSTLALAVLIISATAIVNAQKRAEPSAQKLAVEKAFANFIEAFNNLEWERFRQCFSDDATVFNPAIPEVSELHRLDGRKQIETVFQGVFAATKRGKSGPPYLDIRPTELRVQILVNAAIVTFHFNRGGSSFGRRTLVLEKRGGRWLIVHLHASNA
jgi:ketosteroid isomerase-like protein